MTNNLTSGFLGALCIAAIGSFQCSSLSQLTSDNKNIFGQNNYLNVKQLKILKHTPSLGFGNSVANWGFIQFLQYFGDEEARSTNGYSLSSDYLSAVLAHDPYYKDFYLFLSESTTFYAGMPNRTVEIMETRLSYLKENRAPDSYYIWRYKGTDELLFLDDSKIAQQSFEMAAIWAEESPEKDSKLIAALSKQTAVFLASDPDSTQAKIGAWANVLTTSRDEQTQTRAIQSINKLGGKVVVSDTGGVSIDYPSTSQKED